MPHQSIHGLCIKSLHCQYGQRTVLDGITLPDVQSGQVVALLGPNGSGKSSLLRSIAGLVPACAERLNAGTTDLRTLPAAQRSPYLRYLPQSPLPPLHLTVLECLRVGSRLHHGSRLDQAHEARMAAQLAELKIEHLAHEWLDTLSGGQRQLVGLAQFLLDCPDIMLLDEPLSALDISFQHLVMQCLKQRVCTRPALAVVVMHDLNMALQHADSVLVLNHGALAGDGLAGDVFTPALLETVFGVRGRLVYVPECRHPVLVAESPTGTQPAPETQPVSSHNV